MFGVDKVKQRRLNVWVQSRTLDGKFEKNDCGRNKETGEFLEYKKCGHSRNMNLFVKCYETEIKVGNIDFSVRKNFDDKCKNYTIINSFQQYEKSMYLIEPNENMGILHYSHQIKFKTEIPMKFMPIFEKNINVPSFQQIIARNVDQEISQVLIKKTHKLKEKIDKMIAKRIMKKEEEIYNNQQLLIKTPSPEEIAIKKQCFEENRFLELLTPKEYEEEMNLRLQEYNEEKKMCEERENYLINREKVQKKDLWTALISVLKL